ncbi:MAG: hypothetical protein JRD89_01115 [Deltaproteobacteria bacterium]|nr:hypothetical protein [Deltaproteobacteria bacterium]
MANKSPSIDELRERIMTVKEDEYRHALMFQFLVGGRISEVCGKYAPTGSHAFRVNFLVDGEEVPAVLFAVKTAKRRGRLRPAAVPLDPRYEPFTKPLYDWFRTHEHPFALGPTPRTSVRYLQSKVNEVFEGFEWPMKPYRHPRRRESTPSVCPNCKGDTTEYCRRCKGTGIIYKRLKVPRRWKNFTSHNLRKARTIELKRKYGFDGSDLAAYCGWTEKTADAKMPDVIEYYLYEDITEFEPNKDLLVEIAATYFPKLTRPRSVVGYIIPDEKETWKPVVS